MINKPQIILASTSKARLNILKQLSVVFEAKGSNYEEKTALGKGESCDYLAKKLALGKARDVAKKVNNALVIGADSFGFFQGELFPKPHTKTKAIEFLKKLNGKKHEFYTGIAVIDTTTGRELVECITATVQFRQLTHKEIQDYVAKENDVTTAGGAYRIQNLGASLVKKTEGDYYAIVGLSPSKLQEMFLSLGYTLFSYISAKTL